MQAIEIETKTDNKGFLRVEYPTEMIERKAKVFVFLEDQGMKTVTDNIELSEEQMQMLEMSNEDIRLGRLVEQSELDAEDMKWL